MGGDGADTIQGGGQPDVIFGDNGFIDYVVNDGDRTDIDVIESLVPHEGESDEITDDSADDIIVGGAAGDTIRAGDGDNIVIGDSGRITSADEDAPDW
ncbi:MAG: hypothetical protein ACYTGC_19925, partial [Planctomycetota bacterium]